MLFSAVQLGQMMYFICPGCVVLRQYFDCVCWHMPLAVAHMLHVVGEMWPTNENWVQSKLVDLIAFGMIISGAGEDLRYYTL